MTEFYDGLSENYDFKGNCVVCNYIQRRLRSVSVNYNVLIAFAIALHSIKKIILHELKTLQEKIFSNGFYEIEFFF